MSKLLIVDDEIKIREVIKEYAKFEGYSCLEASSGYEAIDMCDNQVFDLIIMDIMMPKLDGFSAVKEIRKNSDVPIIMLSARGEEYDKLFGFEVGIDDYVTKPFSPKELMARIKAVLKRKEAKEDDVVLYKDLKIDNLAHEVSINNEKLFLTPKEYELLKYLLVNKNIVLTREQLLNKVWNMDYYGDERTIDTHIKTLRSHLDKYRNNIVTVRGVGYKFESVD